MDRSVLNNAAPIRRLNIDGDGLVEALRFGLFAAFGITIPALVFSEPLHRATGEIGLVIMALIPTLGAIAGSLVGYRLGAKRGRKA